MTIQSSQPKTLLFKSAESEDLKELLNKMVTVAGVTIPVAMLLRYLTMSADTKERKSREKVEKFVNARYPVISLDPSLRDTRKEEKERMSGILPMSEQIKEITAEDQTLWGKFKDAVSNITAPVKAGYTGVKSLGKGHPATPAAILLTIIASSLAGAKLSDWMRGRSEASVKDSEIANSRNELDKLLYEQYRKTRGIEHVAGDPTPATPDTSEKKDEGSFTKGLLALYLTYAALTGGAAGYVAKKIADKSDERRKARKQLVQFAREQMIQRSRPTLIDKTVLLGEAPSAKSLGERNLSTVELPI